MRSAAATLRGAYLRAWRYGPGFDHLVEQALERERWSPAQWQQWRGAKTAELLHRAATRVPFYRAQWTARRRNGDQASWELLENWPLLEKDSLRQHAPQLIADDCQASRMYHEHTSGTTGKSIDLWFSRQALREWYALHEARTHQWHGVSRRDRWAILGGQLVAPVAQQEPPFWVWNAAFRQLYLSVYHISSRTATAYATALRDHQVRYMVGYPSAMHALAKALDEQSMRGPTLDVAISNAEPLSDEQRATIGRVFDCAVRDTYGMSEAAAAASECNAGRMHVWPEAGVLEVLDENGQAVKHEQAGELVSTGLLNFDMPLIRYRVGDRGALASDAAACTCGRALPMLAFVEGRTDDLLYTRDGRTIGRLDPVFKARLPVREAQIIQETLDRIRVRYVPDAGFTPADGSSIADRIRDRMGDVTVVLEEMTAIPRTSNGKFRAVICRLTSEERATLAASPRP